MGPIEYSIIDTVVYEYMTDVVSIRSQEKFTKYLNEYGNNAWELVSASFINSDEMQLIFKRKKVRV